MKKQTYITYLHPGSFMSNESTEAVNSIDPVQHALDAAKSAFAFSYHDVYVDTHEVEEKTIETRSEPMNQSPIYYIDAEKFTIAELAKDPKNEILISNLNGRDAVKCRTGNMQALRDKDHIVGVPTVNTQTRITYSYPGLMFSNTSSEFVPERNPAEHAASAKEAAFAFTYEDVEIASTIIDGKPVESEINTSNQSGTFYIDGEEHTPEQIEGMPNTGNIVANIEANGAERAVLCRTGNWQLLRPNDQIVPAKNIL